MAFAWLADRVKKSIVRILIKTYTPRSTYIGWVVLSAVQPPRTSSSSILPRDLVGFEFKLLALDKFMDVLGVLVYLGSGLIEKHCILRHLDQVIFELGEMLVLPILNLGANCLEVDSIRNMLVILRVALKGNVMTELRKNVNTAASFVTYFFGGQEPKCQMDLPTGIEGISSKNHSCEEILKHFGEIILLALFTTPQRSCWIFSGVNFDCRWTVCMICISCLPSVFINFSPTWNRDYEVKKKRLADRH